ncbi:MAG: hypothetical protein SF162_05355 [bacterium]|nr:hypothetical protein [bacterium]
MKRELRDQARQMRLDGETVGDIAKVLGVAKSTISSWVRDIQLTDLQVERIKQTKTKYGAQNKGSQVNRAKYLAVREAYQEEGRLAAMQMRPLHMAGCMLYWAEGAKARNGVYFVNADPHMLQLFMRFLREEMHVVDDEITIKIHCHFSDRETQQQLEQYWLKVLELPPSAVRKTQYKIGSEYRKNTLVNGVCGIRVHRSRILQHIYGAIQQYGGFENRDWLF